MKKNIWSRFNLLLESAYHNPKLIKGSGLGFEESFEKQLLRHGIFPSKRVGYERHPNGPQRWPDFHIYDERTLIPIELKTTRRKTVHIGQTWIEPDAIYLISHHSPLERMPFVFIGWGRDMKTDEDDRKFREFRYALKEFKHYHTHKTFLSSVEWTLKMELMFRMDKTDRHYYYSRVVEDLNRL